MKDHKNYISYLHDLSMEEAIKEWGKLDKNGTDQAAIRTLCLTDLFYLLVRVCRRHDMLHPWVYQRCRMVEREPYGCLDLWSREHFKSSLITFGATIQEILRDPEITIGIFSHNSTIAGAFLLQIKQELENNSVLKTVFPDILYDNPQSQAQVWNTEAIKVKREGNPKENTVEAWGLVGQQPTSKHYALLIYDDIVTDKSVTTPEQIENTTKAFQDSLAMGKDGGKRKIVGTRWSWADTYQDIITRGTARPRIFPATDNGTPEGKPVLFTDEYWKDKV